MGRGRGRRVGERLIDAAAAVARDRGMANLEWYTAPDNATAQRLYDRTGAARSRWVAYELDLWIRPRSAARNDIRCESW